MSGPPCGPLIQYVLGRSFLAITSGRRPVGILIKALGDAISLKASQRREAFGLELLDEHPTGQSLHDLLALFDGHFIDQTKCLLDEVEGLFASALVVSGSCLVILMSSEMRIYEGSVPYRQPMPERLERNCRIRTGLKNKKPRPRCAKPRLGSSIRSGSDYLSGPYSRTGSRGVAPKRYVKPTRATQKLSSQLSRAVQSSPQPPEV